MNDPYPLKLKQPTQGYRYNIDSFLLARFAKFHKTDLVCDLGTGVGILGLLALSRGGVKAVKALEVQEELSKYAQENVLENGFENRMEVISANWKAAAQHFKSHSFDVVISNPPYRKKESGKISAHPMKAIARQEIQGSLTDLLKATSYLLKPKGRFYVIYPVLRLEDFVLELSKAKLKIQRMAFIHPYEYRLASHFMTECVRTVAGEIRVEAPVVVYQDRDHYRPEIEAWVENK